MIISLYAIMEQGVRQWSFNRCSIAVEYVHTKGTGTKQEAGKLADIAAVPGEKLIPGQRETGPLLYSCNRCSESIS